MDTITVKTKDELTDLTNTEGKLVYVGDEQKYYFKKDEQWIQTPVQINSEGSLGINLYELNKQLVSQLEFLTPEAFNESKEIISNFMINNNCYMLYGKDIGYFTLFMYAPDNPESSVDVVYECLTAAFGDKIYSIEVTEDNTAVEIWVNFMDQATVLYLFDYSKGIVYYGC